MSGLIQPLPSTYLQELKLSLSIDPAPSRQNTLSPILRLDSFFHPLVDVPPYPNMAIICHTLLTLNVVLIFSAFLTFH